MNIPKKTLVDQNIDTTDPNGALRMRVKRHMQTQ